MLINYFELLEFDRAVIHPGKDTHDAVAIQVRGKENPPELSIHRHGYPLRMWTDGN